MKVGQTVSYVDRDGKRQPAIITGIPGAGPSRYKKLNLRYKVEGTDVGMEDVPYQADSEGSQVGFWLQRGEPLDANHRPSVDTPKRKTKKKSD